MQGGQPERTSPLASTPRALAFDACQWLQSRLPPPPAPEKPPLFILGLWRSGTTLAHGLVSALPGFTAPLGWQCFRPASFRLAAPPRAGLAIARPMDDLSITPLSPQEDEFALLLMGLPSLYRGFLDPRRLESLLPLLDGADGSDWVVPFRAFTAAIAEQTPGRLVVKSPNHLFRLAAIRQHFPQAPILLLLRDPATLYWSNLRMWRAMTGLYGHWPMPEGAIESFIASSMAAAARHFTTLAAMRRQGAPIALCHFADLAADPARAIADALAPLGYPLTAADRQALAATAAAMRATPRTTPAPLPPHAEAPAAALSDAIAALYRATAA